MKANEINYYYSQYNSGGIYIAAVRNGELYADVTICLVEYGFVPDENQIIIPLNDISEKDYEMFLKDLTKRQIKTIKYGPYASVGVLVELRDDWKECCICMEE